MPNLQAPPRVVDQIQIQIEHTSAGKHVAIGAQRTILCDERGMPLPEPLAIKVHAYDQLAMLCMAMQQLIGKLAHDEMEANKGVVQA